MRSGAFVVMGFALVGCGPSERESMDPGRMEREAIARGLSQESPEQAPHRAAVVRCACDAEGGLHVQAPADARVTETGSGAAEIVLDDTPERQPIRVTKSLGFIGDNPLTPNVSYGGPWNAPDGVLPKRPIYNPYDPYNPWVNDAPMPRPYSPRGYRPHTRGWR